MNQELWDGQVVKKHGEFLQSWQWGEFQKNLGREVLRFFDEELGLAQIISTPLPLGLSWAYVPRGPLFFNKEKANDLVQKIIQLVPKNTVFISLELLEMITLPNGLFGFRSRQPERTLILDLSRSEANLLQSFHAKTRYNISLAQKKNLEFVEIGVDEFYKVLTSVTHRQKFKTYPEIYFKKLKEINSVKFFGVSSNGQIIAAGCFYFFGNTASYLHGGSSYQDRALMAPYFLHWQAIKYFKAKGLTHYDFWGIDEQKWPGVTRFKLGFGGEVKKYPGSYVKILKPFWFKIYKLVKSL